MQDDASPAFGSGVTIGNQLYLKDVAIATLQLPAASGGNGTLTYTLTPAAPAGLTADTGARTLTGTPTATQRETTYTWRVSDQDGDTAELTFTIEVQDDASPAFGSGVTIGNQLYLKDVAIATLQLPAASGGNGTLTYTLTPAAPAGLTADTGARTLTGTPTATQRETTYTWRVSDQDGDTAELTFTIEVQDDASPAFGSGVTIGNQLYLKDVAIATLQLPAASGGNGTLTYTLTPAAPAGLTADTGARTLTGTPTATQRETTYTWRVSDQDGDTAELTFTIEVQDDASPAFGSGVTIGNQLYLKDVAIATLQLPAASGGNGTLTYTLTPAAPAGLTADTGARTLTGTPTATQRETTYTWRVSDQDGDTAELTFTIEVQDDASPAFGSGVTIGNQLYLKDVAIATLQLPAASGGNGTLTYTLTPAAPAGLTADTGARTLTGTPTATQRETTYTWRVSDQDGDTAELTFTIEVQDDASPAFGSGVTIGNQLYLKDVAIATLQLPAASGGNGTLTYTLTPAAPAGLTADTGARTLTGTPTATQRETTYTWRVTDAGR